MARPNYSFKKRQREIAKKKKREEKRKRKLGVPENESQENQPGSATDDKTDADPVSAG